MLSNKYQRRIEKYILGGRQKMTLESILLSVKNGEAISVAESAHSSISIIEDGVFYVQPKPMMYPKGEKFQYNNSGYVLLAMIIEKVTGMYFDRYLKESIFDVCGMKSTGYYELDKLPARCANNYIYCNDTEDYRTNIFSVDVKGTGAGGAFITVKDIVSFWNNLLEGNLISKSLVSDMLSKQSGDGADAEEGYYGYGMWIIDNPGGKDFAYFQGCDPGVSFISEYNPNNGIISVLVSNYGDNVWREMRKIREVLY